MNKELIQLINDNLDLPIIALVEPDVVQDDCHYWTGKISGKGEIKEYVELDYSYTHVTDCDWLFKDDTEEWEEYRYECLMEEDMLEEEANKKIQEELDNLEWKKAIFVYVESL